jgi:hypothetical protein
MSAGLCLDGAAAPCDPTDLSSLPTLECGAVDVGVERHGPVLQAAQQLQRLTTNTETNHHQSPPTCQLGDTDGIDKGLTMVVRLTSSQRPCGPHAWRAMV